MMPDRGFDRCRQVGIDGCWRRVTGKRVCGRAGCVAAMCAIADQRRRLGGKRCGRSIVVRFEGRESLMAVLDVSRHTTVMSQEIAHAVVVITTVVGWVTLIVLKETSSCMKIYRTKREGQRRFVRV